MTVYLATPCISCGHVLNQHVSGMPGTRCLVPRCECVAFTPATDDDVVRAGRVGALLSQLFEALGWQGGTVHQALAEVRKLAELRKAYDRESTAHEAEMQAARRKIAALQPCPWCRTSARVEMLGGDHEGPPYWVGCTNPNCEAAGPVRDTEAEAVEAWNRVRLEPEPSP